MDKQNPADNRDIFEELYGTDDGNWAKPIEVSRQAKPKAPKLPSGGKTKSRRAGAGGVVLAVALVVIIIGFAAFFALRQSCVFGHNWLEANCLEPRRCSSCDETEGNPLGHLPGKRSCTAPTICLHCDSILEAAPGHTWRAAYQDCEYCFARFPENMKVSADALSVNTGDETHFYKVFAFSANKWAGAHVKESAELFSFSQKPTWEDALQICADYGGRMAQIPSAEIQNAVFEGLIQNRFPETQVYFGLTDMEEEGQWVWLTGEALDYSNWHDGQPDGKNYENHAGFYGDYYDGSWRDANFKEDIRYFIIEWILPNY